MKESIRRLVLFISIVGLGSVLIFANLPLIYMLPLVVVVGLILLIVLGAVTIAEIKASFAKLSLKNLRGRSLLKRKDSTQSGGKKTPVPPPKETTEKKPVKSPAAKITEKTGGIKGHLSLLVSSIGSLKSILTERKKPVKKPEEINKLLDRTISEKVSRGSALESAAAVPTASGSGGGGGGGALPAENADETDPFLSLSGEELETGLLDGLDDAELDGLSTGPAEMAPDSAGGADPSAELSMPDLDMPDLPDSDTNAEADAILKAHAEPGTEEFENLEGGDAIDENLGDLDNINLDDIDLGDDSTADEPAASPESAASPAAATSSGSLIPATPLTPAAEPEPAMDQSDISSFAAGSGPGSDDDMLSSLASDIKQVKKEKDVSLLRELKDFKAPAADIEQELQEMAGQLDTASDKQKKKKAPVQGLK